MKTKLKTLGLTIVAVLAMSAVVASAAQAQFTSNAYPTTVTATSPLGNDVWTVDGSSIECSSHFQGSLSEASTGITIIPTYTNCKAFGFASETVQMNGCAYIFHSNGAFDIECPAGKVITRTAGNCEVQIGPQSGLSSVGLTNKSNHIDMIFNVSGITVNVSKDGFLCPLNGTGHKSATYKQATAMTAVPVSGGTDLTVD